MFNDSLLPACLASVGYYLIALLAVYAPDSRPRRLLTLSITLSFVAWSITALNDVEPPPPELRVPGMSLMLLILTIAMRSIELTVSAPRSLRRLKDVHDDVSAATPPDVPPLNFKAAAIEAIDLATNLRRIGWPSKRAGIPHEKRSQQIVPFLLRAVAMIFAYLIACDIIQNILRYLYPSTFRSSDASIYDASLPPLRQYAQSIVLTTWVNVFSPYLVITSIYLFGTIIGITIFQQSPDQWPPLFDAPWRATSVGDFWGRRWHQLYRQTFIILAGRPLGDVFGRVGAILGVFLLSGLFHNWATWGMGYGTATREVVGYFIMIGVGILLEEAWKRSAPGRNVRGSVGWVWATGWSVGWAHPLVDAWVKRGFLGTPMFPEEWSLGYALVQRFLVRK